jgi:hypothetical protein
MPTRAGAGLPVVALDVLEQGDVVVRTEHVVQEVAQRARLLRELHQEVVLAPLVHQSALHHLGVAADVVVPAGQHDQDRETRVDVHDVAERRRGQRPGGLGDDAVGLVERQHLRAHAALGDGHQLRAAVAHDREGQVTRPADRCSVDEAVQDRQAHRFPRCERGRHARGAGRLDTDHPHLRMPLTEPADRPGQQTATADRQHHDVRHHGQLGEGLQHDRALTGDGAGRVERRHERRAGAAASSYAAAAASS